MNYFVAANHHIMFRKFHLCTWDYTFWNLNMQYRFNLNLQASTDLSDKYCHE